MISGSGEQNVVLHGRLFEEGALIAVARALEMRLGVSRERPSQITG